MSAHALYARELEVLVSRMSRQGRLDPYELLDTYVQLAPSTHPELKNPRKVDLAALVAALGTLPAAFVDAGRVFVVPRLDGFTHAPVPSAGPAAGLLEDGTLVVEGRFGQLSLIGIAAALCALTHELDKVRQLAPPPDEALFGEPSEAEPDGLVQIGGMRARRERDDAGGDEDRGAGGDEDRGAGDDVAGDDEHGPSDSARNDAGTISSLAFTLGVDERSLGAADLATGGTLLRILDPAWEIPEVLLHADFDQQATSRRAVATHRRVIAALAEMGLLGRPLHLWIGAGVITDCLSPYTRELREPIVQWAQEHRDEIGDDLDLDTGALGEDALYALAHDFLTSDPRLAAERREADRTVGIQRFELPDLSFELVDLGRVDPQVCDARLTPWTALEGAPVLVRLGLDVEDQEAAGLASLLETLGRDLQSVTLTLDGTALTHEAGTIVLPDLLVRWAGEQKIAVPGGARYQSTDFAGLVDETVVGGAILSVPHAALLSSEAVASLTQTLSIRAIEVGGGAAVMALADAVWRGQLGPSVELGWALCASRYARTGRPTLKTLGAQAALAIALLRKVLVAVEPPRPAKRDRPRPPSGRTMRIKA